MATYVAVFALVLAYVALVAAYCALRALARMRRSSAVLARGARGATGNETLLEVTGRHVEMTASVAEQLRALREHVDQVLGTEDAPGALRHTALVRYDAFDDISGRMSFSLALLDEGGSGVTISAIAGRSDTRVYAKSVRGGTGEHELSPEEREAVSSALDKRRGGLLHRKAS